MMGLVSLVLHLDDVRRAIWRDAQKLLKQQAEDREQKYHDSQPNYEHHIG